MDPQPPPDDSRLEISDPSLAGSFEDGPRDDAPASKWPAVVGTISIVYAALGILWQTCAGASIVMSDWLMQLGGIEVDVPVVLKVVAAASAALLALLGIVLLVAGIGLVRRRRASIGRHKLWAVLRILMVVVGTVAGIVLMPASLEIKEAAQEATNRQMRDSGRDDLVKEFDEEKEWRNQVIWTGVMAVLVSVYPLFLVTYLSRKAVADEAAEWT